MMHSLIQSDIFSHIPDMKYTPRWAVLLIDLVLCFAAYIISFAIGSSLFTYGIDPEVLEHIRFCFPDGFYVDPGCNLTEELRRIRALVLPLRPEFHVRCDRLRYIECRRRKLYFHYPDYTRTTNYPIKKLPDLSEYGLFRCHGSYYVNFDYVDTATPDDFRMLGGEIAPISRRYTHVYQIYLELRKNKD